MAGADPSLGWIKGLDYPPDAKPIGCGLHNLGNTCFVNSVLQCLTHTPPLALGCLQTSESALRALPGGIGSARVMEQLVEHIRDALTSDGDVRPFAPSLAVHMQEVSTLLVPGQQEDSHEFLRLLIDAASRQTPAERAEAQGRRPFVENLFLGQLQSSVRCKACGVVSRSAEDFLDLSLEISAGPAEGADDSADGQGSAPADGVGAEACDLLGALRAFLRPEQLEDADQYYCERCKAHVPAEKQLQLHRLPVVLLLHLKRFRQLKRGRTKISDHVPFPLELDMAELAAADTASPGAGSEREPTAAEGPAAVAPTGAGDAEPRAQPPAAEARPQREAEGTRAQLPHAAPDDAPDGCPAEAQAEASGPAGPQQRPCQGVGQAGGSAPSRYRLYAVLVHRGRSVQSGHYLAYVRSLAADGRAQACAGGQGGQGWWCFDDSHVYPVDEECVLGQPAYLAFYASAAFCDAAPPMRQPQPSADARQGEPGPEARARGGQGVLLARVWGWAQLLVLAAVCGCAWLRLELLSAEVLWGSRQLSALGAQLGALWRSSSWAELAHLSASPAASADRFPGRASQPHAAGPSLRRDALQQLEALRESLMPLLILVLVANFSLKRVLGSLFGSSTRRWRHAQSRQAYSDVD